MLPHWMIGFFKALPFAAISYQPLSIYLGRYSVAQSCLVLAGQVAWVGVLFIASRLLWSRLMRSVIIQGG
jgi:ABC-2 type transport system permease protein